MSSLSFTNVNLLTSLSLFSLVASFFKKNVTVKIFKHLKELLNLIKLHLEKYMFHI